MIKTESMKRLMIFIDETDRYHGVNLAAALLERLRKEGISGATVLRGTAGFGSHGTVHTSAILDLQIALPEIITAIDSEAKVVAVLPILEEMIGEGLIVVDDVQATKISKDGKESAARDLQKKTAQQVTTTKMQIEADHHTVAEYMDKSPITLTPQHTVDQIIALMISNGQALLPVIGDQGNLLGIVRSEDLLENLLNFHPEGFHLFGMRGHEHNKYSEDIKGQSAAQVMRPATILVQEGTSMLNATKLMLSQQIKALPVVQGQKLVGVLRLPDVLKIALKIDC